MKLFIVIFIFLSLINQGMAEKQKYKIATGPLEATDIHGQMCKDIVKFVSKDANLDLEILVTKGSKDNIERLRYEDDIRFAIVQSDIIEYFEYMAKYGDDEAKDIIKKLRVVKPLYPEEFIFIARKDDNINFIHEIQNKKINVGPPDGELSLSVKQIYREMFGHDIAPNKSFSYSFDDALRALDDKVLDVIVFVESHPMERLDFIKEANSVIKVLSYDDSIKKASSYYKAVIPKNIYKWVDHDIFTLGVGVYLVTYMHKHDKVEVEEHLMNFGEALCRNMDTLKSSGHQNWNLVDRDLEPLVDGWKYHKSSTFGYKKVCSPCTKNKRILKLCK